METKNYVVDPVFSKVDNLTGEISELKIGVKKHIEDFFCMYLTAWDDFKERDGGLKTVFTWCIIKSSFSRAGDNPEGNFFFMGDVVDYVKRVHPSKSIPALRNDISTLCKRGFR